MASTSTARQIQSALSVDTEDYFQVEAFSDRVKTSDWLGFTSRVERNTDRILQLFADHGAKATFFIVGWVAEQFPALVQRISTQGHEIGCHSNLHRAIWKLNPPEFREDTTRAIRTLEDISGQKVLGYRAPTFSVTRKTLWAVQILADLGIQYDSSVFPVYHDHYGIPDAPRFTFRWNLPTGGSIYELPMTTTRFGGRNLPASGGGYLRLLPFWYNRWAMNRVLQQEQRPVNLYFHPWEIDPDQPRIPGRAKSRLRHYTNLGKMEPRLSHLLRDMRFAPMKEVLEQEIATQRIPDVDLAKFAGSEAIPGESQRSGLSVASERRG